MMSFVLEATCGLTLLCSNFTEYPPLPVYTDIFVPIPDSSGLIDVDTNSQ